MYGGMCFAWIAQGLSGFYSCRADGQAWKLLHFFKADGELIVRPIVGWLAGGAGVGGRREVEGPLASVPIMTV